MKNMRALPTLIFALALLSLALPSIGCKNGNAEVAPPDADKPVEIAQANPAIPEAAPADQSDLASRITALEQKIEQQNQQLLENLEQIIARQRLIDLESMPMPLQVLDLTKADYLPFKGPKDAPVTIVEFSDFQCPYCSRMGLFLEEFWKQRPEEIKLIFVDRPLTSQYRDGYPFHPYAMTAHEAAAEAGAQGKFWEMYHYIFENQRNIFPAARPQSAEDYEAKIKETRENLIKAAGELGLDQAKMRTALETGKHKARIEKTNETVSKLGINSTPTVYVNSYFQLKNPEMVIKLLDNKGKFD